MCDKSKNEAHPTISQMSESISFLLTQVCRAHRGAVEKRMADLGLHAGQEVCLWHLWQEEGQTQAQLISQMCIQPTTLNKMLTRMESVGLIERREDEEDNRVSHIQLTDQSRQLFDAVKNIWHELETETIANISEEEQAILRRLLKQVYQNLTEKS